MRMFQLLLTTAALIFLLGCQKNDQSGPAPELVNRGTIAGPSDGGGGDTCNGKMIESFRVDVTELPEFKEFVQPILTKIAGSTEAADGSPFVFTAKMKNWYLIDCKLQDIPRERKGLYLETYQAALHTSREIFIDSSAYGKMEKQEKAKLLLHEMIMSYYLVKYLTIEQLCKVTDSCKGDAITASKWKMFRPEAYRPLNEEDHQNIRNVTAWLWAQGDALSPGNFASLVKNNDFDKRFSRAPEAAQNKEVEVPVQILLRMFKKHQWSHSFPKYCQFDSTTNVSSSECQTEISAEIKDYPQANYANAGMKQLSVKLKITRDRDGKVLEQEFSLPIAPNNEKIKLYLSSIGSILNAAPLGVMSNWPNSPGIELKEGLKSQMLMFMLNLADPENPEIYQLIYQTYVWYSFEDEIVKKDGVNYKETYGYSNLLLEDSETLFTENELLFQMKSVIKGKSFIKSIAAP